MKKLILAACALSTLLVFSTAQAADSDKDCIKGDAKTVDEAFKLGVQIAKDSGLELGEGEGKSHIHILPEKKQGLFVVEVCSSSCASKKSGG